jgi:uncharacterized repeat protein (TIGR03803 family)
MKVVLVKLVLVLMLIVPSGRLAAQTYTILHSFYSPEGYLTAVPRLSFLSGNVLYGTAFGTFRPSGTVFALNTDGTGFTNISDSFSGYNSPYGPLVLSSNTLYGTTKRGGIWTNGSVFKVNTDGSGFAVLHSFTPFSSNSTNSDGARPLAGLVLSGNRLFGTTSSAGGGTGGTVFTIGTDGTGFAVLHTFVGNDGGWWPSAQLVLSSNVLYGTAENGGALFNGTVFSLNTDGTGFAVLHTFSGSDGGNPFDTLVLSGSKLYGTAGSTVFAVNSDGTGFTNLYNFSPAIPTGQTLFTNSDGTDAHGLFLSGSTFYGITSWAGIYGYGTVFKMNMDGTGFTTLHSFDGSQGFGGAASYDGYDSSAVIVANNTLYGTTQSSIFSLTLPQLQLPTISSAGNYVILAWPTDAIGLTLQSTTNLASPVWTTNLPAPLVVKGQYTVTNPMSSAQQFFRLSQ